MKRQRRSTPLLRGALVVACLSLAPGALRAQESLILRYAQPAERWTDALPLGNGRLGAMVFGGIASERLQLNESTLWSGGPTEWNNPAARDTLAAVRAAVFASDFVKATELAKLMQGPYNQSYQPLGDLRLQFLGEAGGMAAAYERSLDLDRALATVRYRVGDATFTREVFSSFPDQVIVVRLTCDRPGLISLTASADSPLRYAVQTDGSNTLILRGRAPAHVDPSYLRTTRDSIRYDDGPNPEGMTFDLRVRALVDGGTITSGGSALTIVKANAATLLVSAGTSFNGPTRSPGRDGRDASAEALRPLLATTGMTYSDLASRHLDDHQRLFRRLSLDLGSEARVTGLTTDARLERFAKGEADPGLATLLYQYGRYLLIASSRPGGQPANLQGIWNESMRPPWSSNWTLNINTEMNYWPAEVANLAETHEPLMDFIAVLERNGRRTAEINYGAHGWVAHHNADIWAQTAPVGNFGQGDPKWANWSMSGAWLSTHLWDHYAFSRDTRFLRERAWPIMKGASEFCLDWLIEDGKGHLVTAPSTSPELTFLTPDGRSASVSMASTMDMSIIWELFSDSLDAMKVLAIEPDLARKIESARARLYPLKIGARGQLQEWSEDFMETEVHHRHPSHLFGVFPGRRITEATPGFLTAARRALEIRGDEGTGWSLGWKINLWARLHDGDRAYVLAKNLLRPIEVAGGGGGVYRNLFDAHPPFQIDGNFAFTAGVSEMLLQSRMLVESSGATRSEIDLLPALPSAWPKGSVRGLRARGGIELSELSWAAGQMIKVTLVSASGGALRVRCGTKIADLTLGAGEAVTLDARLKRMP